MAQDRSDRGGKRGASGGKGRSGSGRSGSGGGQSGAGGSSSGRSQSGRAGAAGSGRSSARGSGAGKARAGASGAGRSKSGRADARGSGGGGRSGAGSGKGGKRSSTGSRAVRGDSGGRPDTRSESPGTSKARRDLKGAAVDLPFWVIEDLTRVTPKERVSDALTELGNASNAMIEGRYKVALRSARRAKALAPRDATVRETLGLAAYRVGDWITALTELRVYRRLAGEPTHMPIEMDTLRALGRGPEVGKVWMELQKIGAAPAVLKEGLVVYASFLIDEGQVEEARRLVTPGRLKANPYPADLRVWYVAARANALAGDVTAARQIRDAIVVADPGFPGMDDLETTIARSTP